MEHYLHRLHVWVLERRIRKLRKYTQAVEGYIVESEDLLKRLEYRLETLRIER